ncbi:MAG: flagellar basal body L-ring protein FlgH [Armatimonadetes bacterium]|nr:flagellar basal body L-ring protein FlgH [Armatimonadota bacterium]
MRYLIATLAAALLLGGQPSRADSLWAKGQGKQFGNLFGDNKARREGDTLTVLIQEITVSSAKAETKSGKSESGSLGPVSGLLRFLPKLSAEGQMNANASGTTTRAGSLVGKITVTVLKVLPNGNLQVEGSRTVGVNKEKEKITLKGIVRPGDIATDNTVSSSSVANAEITYEGKGPVGDRQRPGILSQLLKVFF